jgi:predicted sugar kinase
MSDPFPPFPPLAGDAAAPVRADPCEVAFYVRGPAAPLRRFLDGALGAPPAATLVTDRYLDSRAAPLLARGASLRLRQYGRVDRARETIVIALASSPRPATDDARFPLRRHHVAVQHCPHTAVSDDAVLRHYGALGFTPCFGLRKWRHGYEVVAPTVDATSRRVRCAGLRILLDELESSRFPASTVIELEFDAEYDAPARELTRLLLERFGDSLLPKRRDKRQEAAASSARPRSAGARSRSGVAADDAPRAPGERLRVDAPGARRGWAGRRAAVAVCEAVEVCAPARLHLATLAPERLRPGRPGGGGLGISVSAFETRVWLTPESDGRQHELPPSARHTLRLFAALVGADPAALGVRLDGVVPFEHAGFGSTVTRSVAILWGLNVLFGLPFSRRELAALLARNYVEDHGPDQVVAGIDTGVGAACALFGGLVWVDRAARFAGCIPTPELFAVTALGRRDALGAPAPPPAVSAADGDALRRHVRARLRPRFARGELRELLGACVPLAALPAVAAEKLHGYRRDVIDAVTADALRGGALYAGLSSEGPTVFALVEGRARAEAIRDRLEDAWGTHFAHLAVAPAGRTLRHAVHRDPADGERAGEDPPRFMATAGASVLRWITHGDDRAASSGRVEPPPGAAEVVEYLRRVRAGSEGAPYCPFVRRVERHDGYHVRFHGETVADDALPAVVSALADEHAALAETYDGARRNAVVLVAAFTHPSHRTPSFCARLRAVQDSLVAAFARRGRMIGSMSPYHPLGGRAGTPRPLAPQFVARLPLVVVRRLHPSDHVFLRTDEERRLCAAAEAW